MKIIKNRQKFVEITQPIYDYEFCEFDIRPDMGYRQFSQKKLNELVEFCKVFPQCHIISVMKNLVYVNSPVLGALCYELATGDADPEIMLIVNLNNYKSLEDLALSEFNSDTKQR